MSETTSTPPRHATSDAADDAAAAAAAGWAGLVRFPRGPGDLRSVTACPACQAALHAAVCGSCALDLRHPAAAELAELSARAADLLDARRTLIGRLRRDAAAATAATATTRAHAPTHPPVAVPMPEPVGAPGGMPPQFAAGQAPPAMPDRPRRSGIQVALLVVGVSLLSIFAIFWLAYAFVVYGSTVRMLIIAAGTLATLAAAAALSRRGLRATAEGIAVLGTIILVLDAWALRANDPEGIGAVEDPLYWGLALLIISALAVGWSRVGRLAAPAVAAALVLPLGVALTVGHVADTSGLAPDAVAVIAGLAAYAAALAHPLLTPSGRSQVATAVRVAALATAAPGALLALGAGVGGVIGEIAGSPLPLLAGLGLALISAVHVIVAARETHAPVLGVIVAGTATTGGVLALLAGVTAGLLQIDDAPFVAALALLVVTAAAVTLTLLSRPAERAYLVAWMCAVVSASVVAVLAGLATLAVALQPALDAIASIGNTIDSPAMRIGTASDSELAAVAGIAAALGLVAVGGLRGGALGSRTPLLLPLVAVLALAAGPLLGYWWAAFAVAAVLAVVPTLLLARARALLLGSTRTGLLAAIAVLTIGGSIGALALAPRVDSAWILGVAVALITIALARRATPAGRPATTALGAAIVVILASAPALQEDLSRAGLPATTAGILLALAALLIAAATLGRLASIERLVVAAIAATAGVGAGLLVIDAPTDERTAIADGIAAILALAALSLTVTIAQSPRMRIPAAALLAPSVALLALVALRGAASSADASTAVGGIAVWGPVATLGALVIVAATALVLLERRKSDARRERIVLDAGTAAVALAMLLTALGDDAAATALIASAVLVLLIAISHDGLIGSRSRRRYFGWVALALGAVALWTNLVRDDVADPEGYALPLAGALLLIAAALARRRAADDTPSRSAAPLIAAAVAVALLPLALFSGIADTAPTVRSLVVGITALALLASAVLATDRLEARTPMLPVLLAGAAVLALGTLAATLVGQLIVTTATPLDEQLRGALIVIVLAASAVAVRLGPPSTVQLPATAALLGLSALAAGALGAAEAVAPVELVSAPVALAALAIGMLELERRPRARSWSLLGPGLAILLGPSLIAIGSGPEPWRIVGLGVIAAGVMVGGLQQRLQAPFVLGGAVLIVHSLVQSWPLLSRAAAAVDWWIWLGIVGIVVIAVAARYERRVQNVAAVARRISELR